MTISTDDKLRYIYPTGKFQTDWVVLNDNGTDRITFWLGAVGPQPTQAELDAITEQQVVDAYASTFAKTEKAEASKSVDDALQQKGNRVERIVMSVATSAVKVVNNDRTTLGQMNAAVQAATSLADLKSRFAAINWPNQITMAQLQDSIKADIAATPE